MWTRRALSALAAAAVLVVAGCGSDQAGDTGASGGSGQAAGPSELTFTATTVNGEEFDTASLDGEPAVFWFWAPWCSTCAAEAPYVLDLAKRYDDRVNVVGVASLGQPSEMAEFIDRTETSTLTHLNDEVGSVWQHFGITAQSTFALVDSAGTTTYTGYLEPSELDARVAELTA
jgi:thiol-disulfide isomerase/thioredoxin